MSTEITRRRFVKETMLLTAGVGLGADSYRQHAHAAAAPVVPSIDPAAGMPQGKIGKLQVSRLILGGNLLTHFTHSRDLNILFPQP